MLSNWSDRVRGLSQKERDLLIKTLRYGNCVTTLDSILTPRRRKVEMDHLNRFKLLEFALETLSVLGRTAEREKRMIRELAQQPPPKKILKKKRDNRTCLEAAIILNDRLYSRIWSEFHILCEVISTK